MNTGSLTTFVIVAVSAVSLLMGICIGVMVESKSLLKWFNEELDIIKERYKRKYGEDGDEDEQEKED